MDDDRKSIIYAVILAALMLLALVAVTLTARTIGMTVLPTFRWHPKQHAYLTASSRMCTNHSGRRSGKTEGVAIKAIVRSLSAQTADYRVGITAPTRQQVKDLYWGRITRNVPRDLIADVSITELRVKLVNGSEIWLIGLDRAERMEGTAFNGIVVDEIDNTKPGTFKEHIRPMLTDRLAWFEAIGVPEGRKEFYRMVQDAEECEDGSWSNHHWTTEEVLPLYCGREEGIGMGLSGVDLDRWCIEHAEAELEQARNDMDPLTYAQEYLGRFVNLEGLAYYSFSEEMHVVDDLREGIYDPSADIMFCFDFNISPGVAVVMQEHKREALRDFAPAGVLMQPEVDCVIDEVYIERGSNTIKVCQALVDAFPDHQGFVYCYGDATGGAGGSAQIDGSDWDLIRQQLKAQYGPRVRIRVPDSNPRERARVNASNSRLLSASGLSGVLFDRKYAKMVWNDHAVVSLKPDGSGAIDKDTNKYRMNTHNSDACGYCWHERHPVTGGAGSLVVSV